MAKKNLWYWGINHHVRSTPPDPRNDFLPHLVGAGLNWSWKHITVNREGAHGITENGDLYGWGNDCDYAEVATKVPPYYKRVWYCVSLTGKGRKECRPGQPGYDPESGFIKNGRIVRPEEKWKDVSRGVRHVAGITRSGRLYSWGTNFNGELGRGREIEQPGRLKPNQVVSYKGIRFYPVEIMIGGNDWIQVKCGFKFSIALKEDGSVWYWPTNGGRGCSDCFKFPKPLCKGQFCGPKKIATDFKKIACTFDSGQVYGLKKDTTICKFIRSFGSEAEASVLTQLGDGWKDVTCNFNDGGGGIKEDGTLWTWGPNYSGELGINKSKNEVVYSSSPVQTTLGGNDWKSITTGNNSNTKYAIKNNGSLWCWGGNSTNIGIGGLNFEVREPIQNIKDSVGWKMVSTDVLGTLAIRDVKFEPTTTVPPNN